MKKILLCLMVLLLTPTLVFAEEKEYYTYSDLSREKNYGVAGLSDGSYVITGYREFYDEVDRDYKYNGYLIKYDKDNKVVWKSENAKNFQFIKDVEAISDGFLAITEKEYNEKLVKFDLTGKVVWESEDFPASSLSSMEDVEVLNNGDILVIGTVTIYDFQPNGLIVKFGKDGKYINKYEYGDRYTERFYGGSETSDGGLVASGLVYEFNSEINGYQYVPLAVKFDKDFNVEWSYKGVASPSLENDSSCYLSSNLIVGYKDIVEDGKGNYYAVGNSREKVFGIDPDMKKETYFETSYGLVTKFDKDGKVVWEDTYHKELNVTFNDVTILSNGRIFVVGQSGHATRTVNLRDCVADAHYYDALLFEYGEDGEVIEENVYDGSKNELLENIDETEDDVYVTVGEYESDDLDEIELIEERDGLIITIDKKEPVLPNKDIPKEEEKIENPKTGVASYISLLVLVLLLAGIIYHNTRKNDVFKGL